MRFNIRNIVLGKKGVSVIEFIAAFLVLAIIAIAAGNLLRFQGKFMKDFMLKEENSLECQLALEHMVRNINRSAWIEVAGSDVIRLHSHSSPNIREYKFEPESGELKYKEGEEDHVILASGIEVPEGPTKPEADFFKGEGEERLTRRFQKVRIEFSENSDPDTKMEYLDNDIFYAKTRAIAKEEWDIIYVDPIHVGALEDGTKIYPLSTIEAALAMVTPVAYSSFAVEKIVVLSGEHTFSGNINFENADMTIFTSPTTLTIEPGITLDMGYCAFYIRGDFYCQGTPGNIITIRSSYARAWNIVVGSSQPDFNFSYLDISGALHGIDINPYRFRRKAKTPFSVLITNNYTHNNSSHAFSIESAQNLEVYNNTFENHVTQSLSILSNVLPSGVFNENIAPPGEMNHAIYQNTFTGGDSQLYLVLNVNSANTILQEIHDNIFEGAEKNISYLNDKNGLIQTRFYNNTIRDAIAPARTTLSIGITLTGRNTKPSSKIMVDHNTIDGADKLMYGIWAQVSRTPIFISNNDVHNMARVNEDSSYSQSAPGGVGAYIYRCGRVSITNNVIHDNERYGIESRSNSSVDIKNNIFYGEGNIYSQGTGPRLTNNTITTGTISGSGNWQIKNSIIWEDATIDSSLHGFVTFSDVKGVDLGGTNISQDPLFVDSAAHDYHLQAGSPCVGTGEDGVDMGAYGGPGASDWASGVGVQ